jgi:hypothetical protein
MTLWKPTDLTSVSLQGWYRLRDVTGTDVDGADLTYSSGSVVATWADKSGNGRNLAVEGTQSYNSNGLATGHPGLTAGASGFGGFRTAASVGYPAAAVIGAIQVCIVNAGGRGVSLYDGTGNDYDTHGTIPISLGTTSSQYFQNFATATSPTYTSGAVIIVEGVPLSTTTADSGVNGVLSGTPCSINMTGETMQRLGLFCNAVDASSQVSGVLAETVVWSGVISTSDLQKLEGYIAWNNGRQASLPGGHPYAGAAPTAGGGSSVGAVTGSSSVLGYQPNSGTAAGSASVMGYSPGGVAFTGRPYYDLNTRISNV